jgi:cytochrome P450
MNLMHIHRAPQHRMTIPNCPLPETFRDPRPSARPGAVFSTLPTCSPVLRVHGTPGDNGSHIWFVVRHGDVRQVLATPDTGDVAARGDGLLAQPGILLALDDPEHSHLRTMRVRESIPRRVRSVRP